MKNTLLNAISQCQIKVLCICISVLLCTQWNLKAQVNIQDPLEKQLSNRAFTGTTVFENNPVSVFRTAIVEPVEILTDPTGNLSIDDISRLEQDELWLDYKALKSEPNEVYWLRTTLIGTPSFKGAQFFHISEIQGLLGYYSHYNTRSHRWLSHQSNQRRC